MNSSVTAVVVTHHPEIAVLDELLTAVSPQVAKVIAIDNGSSEDALTWFDQHQQQCELIALQENLGIAAAQNRGILRALELGSSHVLLLDQDSIPSADMVSRLLAVERFWTDRGERVGAVGPHFVDPHSGAETWFHARGPLRFRYLCCSEALSSPTVRADLLIASGMLVRPEVFTDVGLMDEALFIDLVDSEWCLRAASAGYGIFGACAAVMYHSIGRRSVIFSKGTGRRGTFPVHKPVRYYYMVRNSVNLSLRNNIPFWWKLNNGMELLFLLVLILIGANRRFESLAMMLRGAVDGFRTCMGHYRG